MKLKIIVAISLIVFVIAFTAIITTGMVNKNQPVNKVQTNNISNTPVVSASPSPGKSNSITLTTVEIAKHNSESDCWLIINNKVYDVTKDIAAHPGGADTILPYCGGEATEAYNTKNKPRPQPHSQVADDQLNASYVGDLVK